MVDENPYRSPESADPTPPSGRRWWQATVPPGVLAVLFMLGILQAPTLALFAAYGLIGRVSPLAAGASLYVFCASVGGLIGFALSKKRVLLINHARRAWVWPAPQSGADTQGRPRWGFAGVNGYSNN